MKSNEIKALEARLEHLKRYNRPEQRIQAIRTAIKSIMCYELLIEKFADNGRLCELYASKIREIFNTSLNG